MTSNANSGTLTVVGTTTMPATNVSVNGSSASIYGDATFAAPGFLVSTANYTALAEDTYGRVNSNSISVSVSSNVAFLYDANGNLTSDGLRAFQYDDENQLMAVWATNAWSNYYTYDGKMRRRIKRQSTWTAGAWSLTNEVHYIYDGNLVLQDCVGCAAGRRGASG